MTGRQGRPGAKLSRSARSRWLGVGLVRKRRLLQLENALDRRCCEGLSRGADNLGMPWPEGLGIRSSRRLWVLALIAVCCTWGSLYAGESTDEPELFPG